MWTCEVRKRYLRSGLEVLGELYFLMWISLIILLIIILSIIILLLDFTNQSVPIYSFILPNFIHCPIVKL